MKKALILIAAIVVFAICIHIALIKETDIKIKDAKIKDITNIIIVATNTGKSGQGELEIIVGEMVVDKINVVVDYNKTLTVIHPFNRIATEPITIKAYSWQDKWKLTDTWQFKTE